PSRCGRDGEGDEIGEKLGLPGEVRRSPPAGGGGEPRIRADSARNRGSESDRRSIRAVDAGRRGRRSAGRRTDGRLASGGKSKKDFTDGGANNVREGRL